MPEQVIEVPMISCPSSPLRAALAATQMAEQLVEVLIERFVVVPRHGLAWCRISRCSYLVPYDTGWEAPPAKGGIQMLGKVDVPVNMRDKFL